MEEHKFKYFAFISYKREDEEWAKWLQYEFEHYKLPVSLNGQKNIPEVFRPIFRDVDELSAGNLPNQIHDSLSNSANLIVICSPKSAHSEWVNKEILDFISIGKDQGRDNLDYIFPFIVEGRPHASNPEEECFPDALKSLSGKDERIGGNVNESGRDKAFVKTLSGIINVGFDELWNRYEQEKIEEERRKREEKNRLLLAQSTFLSEKAMNYLKDGDSYMAMRLVLEALPKNLDDTDDRPYCPEAEYALRQADDASRNAIFRGYTDNVHSVAFSPAGDLLASCSSNELIIRKVSNGDIIHKSEGGYWYNVVFSPDGTKLLTKTFDEVAIWDVESQKIIMEIPAKDVSSAVYSPDGSKIVLTQEAYKIRIIDAIDGQELKVIELNEGYGKNFNYAEFSPDGSKILSAHGRSIRVWDAMTGEELWSYHDRIVDHMKVISMAVFSPDGENIAYTISSYVRVLNYKYRSHVANLDVKEHATSVRYSSDGEQLIASASCEGGIHIWDAHTLHERNVYMGHLKTVNAVCFSPNGNLIASASNDATVRLWDNSSCADYLYDGKKSIQLEHYDFSPDESLIAYANNTHSLGLINTRSLSNSIIYAEENANFKCVSFSPDGKTILAYSNEGVVYTFSTNGDLIHRFETNCAIYSIVFSPDSTKIIIMAAKNEEEHENTTLMFWDVIEGKVTDVYDYNGLCYFGYSPYEHMLLFLDRRSFTISTLDAMGNFKDILFSNGIFLETEDGFVFSPDRKHFAAVYDYIMTPPEIKIWNLETGDLEHTLIGHKDKITSICYSPDGKRLISSSDDRTIIVWDTVSGSEILQTETFYVGIHSAKYSADGKRILAFPENEMSAQIWDAESGKLINNIKDDNDPRHLAQGKLFSPSGKYVIIKDSHIAFLKEILPLQELIDKNRERFKDCPLSAKERKQYYLE